MIFFLTPGAHINRFGRLPTYYISTLRRGYRVGALYTVYGL